MKLSDLLKGSDFLSGLPRNAAAVQVTSVTSDSRRVTPGTLFFALAGSQQDGLAFAADAARKGAVAIVAERKPDIELPIPVVVLKPENGGARKALAMAASRLHPARPSRIVAITGTSGKTSVSVFTRQIWHRLGIAGASLGTIGYVTHKGAKYGSLTTPDPVELHETLSTLAGDGVTHLAMEASSHGLHQHRLDGVELVASAFLNLSRDHLDYHPTMREYFDAKMALFTRLSKPGSTAVISGHAPWRKRAVEVAKKAGLKPLTIGRGPSDWQITSARRAAHGQDLTLRIKGKQHRLHLPLIGDFQASNALVAAALAVATGCKEKDALAALETLDGVPGRLEKVGAVGTAPVLVDYAHKPAALETVLDMLRPYAKGKLICVFGCGGNRDPGKRPMMGRIAIERADVVIVTDDNPRKEDPALVRKAIMAAAPGAIEIGDRKAAIEHAVSMLRDGDVLVVAGKGHEEGQIVGDKTLPFSDHKVCRDAIRRAGGTVTE